MDFPRGREIRIDFIHGLVECRDVSRQNLGGWNRWRERVCEERWMVLGGHLESGMETQCSGNIQESMWMTLMKTPNNRGYRIWTAFCSQARFPVMGHGCIGSSCWPKVADGDVQTIQVNVRTDSHSLKTNSNAWLCGQYPHILWNIEMLSWYLHGDFTTMFMSLLQGKVLSRVLSTNPTKNPWLENFLSELYWNLWAINQQCMV